jgi:hypothetical protein
MHFGAERFETFRNVPERAMIALLRQWALPA